MNDEIGRELTVLEYTILGMLSVEPQSGYSIIGLLEKGDRRLSNSAGAIYPALKRLEKYDIIAGEVEASNELRPRKLYALTPRGETLLDAWLREPLPNEDLLENNEIMLRKFLFAERRLNRAEVLEWLDGYEKAIETYDATRRLWYESQMNFSSLHQQLVLEATRMELDTVRAWIKAARARLKAEPIDSEAPVMEP